MKRNGEKITMLTAYDFTTARICTRAGIDAILVGDSASNVVCGYSTTLPISLDEMIFLAKNVMRGVIASESRSMVSTEGAIFNIGRVIKETYSHAIKLEGGVWLVPLIKRLTDMGIPVVSHIGLMPQFINQTGGYFLQGKSEGDAELLLSQAVEFERAGVKLLVLEKIPATLAKLITQTIKIPTIGIGAGNDVDGQVLVINDLLGMDENFKPKFVRRYADLERAMTGAIKAYIQDVKSKSFPSGGESF
ncbi:hypothetical protein CHS0354_023816 [Potamilus streckersoni]|uniref:3-methyl-2-oxobutanoate hydroxymethyltransferase n=1 Tax=Potamilus streckersoni TaxID=2493646 RepID=A0AAE0RYX4_9BIVA|nr:hypothetical protein CHS0354_023816 [Potamilus streckersoni]